MLVPSCFDGVVECMSVRRLYVCIFLDQCNQCMSVCTHVRMLARMCVSTLLNGQEDLALSPLGSARGSNHIPDITPDASAVHLGLLVQALPDNLPNIASKLLSRSPRAISRIPCVLNQYPYERMKNKFMLFVSLACM